MCCINMYGLIHQNEKGWIMDLTFKYELWN